MFLLILLVFCIIMFILACCKNRPWMWHTVVSAEIFGLICTLCYMYWIENLMPRSGYIPFEGFTESINAFISLCGYFILLLITVPVCKSKYVSEDRPEYI